jgi:hypothetical protein
LQRMARPREMPPQLEGLYQDAVENLRFIKQQQWRVTNYAALIYAAIYVVHKEPPLDTCGGRAGLTVATLVTMVFSIAVLWRLQEGMEKFRRRISFVYERHFTAGERRDLSLEKLITDQQPDWLIYPGLMVVSLAGAALVLVIVWCSS